MAEERRSMFGWSNMSGSEPKSAWSATLSNGKFILFLIALIGAIWGAAGWMTKTAQANFDHRLVKELLPPDGTVFTAIHREVEAFQPSPEEVAAQKKEIEEIKKSIDLMKRQDVRGNQMLERVFTHVTGEQPPPRITE